MQTKTIATDSAPPSGAKGADDAMTEDRARVRVDATAAAPVVPSAMMRWLLASLSAGAGVIHLAMVPQHAQESFGMGLVFGAAGWLQLGFGAAIVTRPTRFLARLAVITNAIFIAVWALSRTVGLPSWTGEASVEQASAVDLLCVAFEVGIIVGCSVILARPSAFAGATRSTRVPAVAIPILVVAATTAALTAPSTADHAHGASDGQSELAGSSAHSHATPDNQASSAPGSGDAGHDHDDGTMTYDQLPPETKAEVDRVIAEWAHKYPTAADAIEAGWFRSTPNLYGIGAHFIKDANGFSVAQPFDLMHPSVLLYDGEGPDARFAGVSYVVADDIEGFTGPYDSWHSHPSVCMGTGGITLTEDNSAYWYSESECTARGGRVLPIAADHMMHLWIGPGYTDAPIFAHDNPRLYDGYYPKRDA